MGGTPMIDRFIEAFEARKGELRARWEFRHPKDYYDLVHAVVEIVSDSSDLSHQNPSPDRIHQIDDGDYQGTLVFIVGCKGYQPSTYWSVLVGYGSCSGCDTLANIRGYSDEPPTEEQVNDYMTECLHIVQRLRLLEEEF